MPIDLATATGPLHTDQADILEDLKDIQGNILNGHGRDYATYAFLRFQEPTKARALLSGLAQGSITSAFDQLQQSLEHKSKGTDAGLFVHAALSASGYRFLKITYLPVGANWQHRSAADEYADVFSFGMKARGAWLDDDSDEWEQPYHDDIHALILIAADDEKMVKSAVEKLTLLLAPDPTAPIATVVALEYGLVQRRMFAGGNAKGDPVEHFGFVDDISQPLFLDRQIKDDKKDWDPVAPPRLVLVKDPNGNGYGSFLVFRKLEQNVRGFWLAAERLSGQLDSSTDVVAAMAVGRFVNGTPVVMAGKPNAGVSRTNQFNYAGDKQGFRCPFQAHTRKTNPRLESAAPANLASQEEERGHRIARRGIPYPASQRDDFEAEFEKLPEGEVGLLFTCYQSDIWEQFEFQQRSWCNEPKFMHPGRGAQEPWKTRAPAYALGTGIDAIVGRVPADRTRHPVAGPFAGNWPRSWDARPVRAGTIAGFVTVKGGEYFFSPSLSGLRWLDGGAPPISLKQ